MKCRKQEEKAHRVHWEGKYVEGYIPWDRGDVSAGFRLFLEEGVFPKDGRILVPGCGHGYEVEALAAAGYDVTAIDIAPTPMARLQQRLQARGLEARLVVDDLLAWQPEQPFDAIFEQTCLCAFPPVDWEAYERAAFRLLRSGGALLALFVQTHREDGPPWHCALKDMQTLFAPTRWEWRKSWPPQPMHTPPLEEIPWMLIRK